MTPPSLELMVPGPLEQRTGGYLYDARVARGLESRGWRVRVHELDGRFPDPDDRGREALDRALGACSGDHPVVVDGLALGASPEVARRHGRRLPLVALVHHPLFRETGLGDHEVRRLRRLETEVLAACRGVVVTSPATARQVEAMGVPPARIRAVPPGTEPAPPARGPDPGQPPLLLCVASVTPRKGHDVLVAALDRIRELPWRCRCVGSLERDPEHAHAVREAVAAAGLDHRIRFVGEKDAGELHRLYHRTSLVVLASHYEGYGMVLAEALARGLPVVSTTGGAIPDTVPDDAGVLVPPGDPEALARALARLLEPEEGPGRREALARAARRRARELPDWDDTASAFATALRELLPAKDAPPRPPEELTFQGSWLELREPVDHRSRAPGLLPPLLEAWARAPGARVVDLGSGTGSNLRWLAPRLPGPQCWTLVDHDPRLLEEAPGAELPERVSLRRIRGDLGREGLEAVEGADLVTASALLDLVGPAWLEAWVAACRRARCPVYVALSYDGTVRWEGGPEPDPGDPPLDDALVVEAVNRHQRRDKGTGPALGPEAAAAAERLFGEAGFRTRRAPSPWRLGPDDAALARAWIDGWARAAREELPGREDRVEAWARHRRRTVASDRFTLTVGHHDLLALPPTGGTGS